MTTSPNKIQILQTLLKHFPTSDFQQLGLATDELFGLLYPDELGTEIPNTFVNFLNTLIINNVKSGQVIFKPRSYQTDFATQLTGAYSRIIHKADRQMGTTLMLTAFAVWTALSNPWQCIEYIVPTFNVSKTVSHRCQDICLNPLYKLHVVSANFHGIQFTNGSRLVFSTASSPWVARGRSCGMIIIENADLISKKYEEDLYGNVFAATHPNGKIIVSGGESSFQGQFYDIWQNSADWHHIEHTQDMGS